MMLAGGGGRGFVMQKDTSKFKNYFKYYTTMGGIYKTTILFTSLISAGVLGIAAKLTPLFSSTAPFSWFFVSLMAFFVIALAFYLIAVSRQISASSRLAKIVAENGNFDVFQNSFENKILNLDGFFSPFYHKRRNKTFKDCEITSGLPVMLDGDTNLQKCHLINCQFVVFNPQKPIINIIGLTDSTFINCKLNEMTLFISEETYNYNKNMFDDHVINSRNIC